MLRDGERNTAPRHDLNEHAGSQDSSPNLVSLVRPSEDSEHPQSEAIMTVLDEMQGTAALSLHPVDKAINTPIATRLYRFDRIRCSNKGGLCFLFAPHRS